MYCETCLLEFEEDETDCTECGGALNMDVPRFWASRMVSRERAGMYRSQARRLLYIGIAVLVGSMVIIGVATGGHSSSSDGGFSFAGVFLFLALAAAQCIFIASAFSFARSKGYPWYTGLLIFVGMIGLLILFVIRDRYRT
ncbi:MAG TPA: hypothetical protein VHI13_19130 [Candidatus Kapabacteria bacterium]|nr:hypothetical protein [Candidatus Kapabacteria bacterium]